MPYQPLVTHYCKKFHEAALRSPLESVLDIEINLAFGLSPTGTSLENVYVHIACPIPRDLHIAHASLGVVIAKVTE